MYSDVSGVIKGLLTAVLIFNFCYTRIFVFGKLILYVWTVMTNWNWIVWYLWSLKVVLWVMHVYWVIEIVKKLWFFIFENKIEDIAKVKPQ
jgi:hypothetical protein